jgi:hypothetical protein
MSFDRFKHFMLIAARNAAFASGATIPAELVQSLANGQTAADAGHSRPATTGTTTTHGHG